jgi:hypothetical protein
MDEDRGQQYDQGGLIPGGLVPVLIHPGEEFYTLQQVRDLLDREDEGEA